MPGDDLAFGLGEVEGKAVGLPEHRDEVDDEGGEEHDGVPHAPLGVDDARGRHRPGGQEHRDEGEAEGELVGDHLGGPAHRPVEGEGRVGRPAAQDQAVLAQGRHSQDEEDRDGGVGHLQGRLVPEDRDGGAHGDDRHDGEGAGRRDDG